MATDTLYESDFFIWTERQAEGLRRAAREGSNLPLDWDNLAEEIESLGRSDRREIESYLRLILEHFIKLAYSPAQDPRAGWRNEIGDYRFHLAQVLRDSPSLRGRLPDAIGNVLGSAIVKARHSLRTYGEPLPDSAEMAARLRKITPEQILDEDWFPEPDVPPGPENTL